MKIKADWDAYLHARRREEMEIIFRTCPRGAFRSGLELGAGDGFQSGLLAEYVCTLTATDYFSERLSSANRPGIRYLACDAEETDRVFAPRQFELVFSSNLLEHLVDPARALRAIHRVLVDDGVTIHVVPSPFWKVCHLLLYVPDRCARLVERISRQKRLAPPRQGIDTADDAALRREPGAQSGSPKIRRVPRRLVRKLFSPEPHGVSGGNIAEFRAFSRSRWSHEFQRAGFELVTVLRGPVASGYGFGMDRARRLLHRIGFTSEYVYIAVKRGSHSRFRQYFEPAASPAHRGPGSGSSLEPVAHGRT